MGLFSNAAQFFKFSATPATPASGRISLYPKSDDRFYKKDSAGAERLVGNALATLSPVRVASTGNIDLAAAPAAIDSITLAANDRVLVRHQTTASQNGVYVFASAGAAMVRASDADTAAKVARGTQVTVLEGSDKYKTYAQGMTVTTLGTDSLEWRSVNVVDTVGMFSFPTPQGVGHMVANVNSQALYVWHTGAWVQLAGVVFCTSSSRPVFASEGVQIYETDTGLAYILVDSVWKPLGGTMAATKTPTRQVFTSGGTWTKPAGMVYCEVEVISGGAAGAGANASTSGSHSCGSGGGGGAYLKKRYNASDLAATETVVVGSGGVGAAASTGTAGGPSSFSSGATLIYATGGGVGITTTNNASNFAVSGGGGGNSTTSIQDITDGGGNGGDAWGAATYCIGGAGGDSFGGGGGRANYIASGTATQAAGSPGRGYGGGGSGAASTHGGTSAAGGNGAPGIVIVTEYYAAGSGAQPIDTWTAAGTSIVDTSSATYVDVPGATVTVPVASTGDRFAVFSNFDVLNQLASTGTFVGQTNVAGVAAPSEAIWTDNNPAVNNRNSLSAVNVITGLTPGNVVFKLMVARPTGSTTYRTNNQHTRITVVKLSGGTDAGAIVCTSTTRPGYPALGDMIYETDTRLGYVWDGSAWKLYGDGDSASVTVTNGTNVNAAGTTAYRRGGLIFVNVTATATANLTNGQALFTLPTGYRPPITTFVTLINAVAYGTDVILRAHVLTDGQVSIQGAPASGVVIRGSFVLPL